MAQLQIQKHTFIITMGIKTQKNAAAQKKDFTSYEFIVDPYMLFIGRT